MANELGQQRPEGLAERVPVEKVVKVARSLRSETSQFKFKGEILARMLGTSYNTLLMTSRLVYLS